MLYTDKDEIERYSTRPTPFTPRESIALDDSEDMGVLYFWHDHEKAQVQKSLRHRDKTALSGRE